MDSKRLKHTSHKDWVKIRGGVRVGYVIALLAHCITLKLPNLRMLYATNEPYPPWLWELWWNPWSIWFVSICPVSFLYCVHSLWWIINTVYTSGSEGRYTLLENPSPPTKTWNLMSIFFHEYTDTNVNYQYMACTWLHVHTPCAMGDFAQHLDLFGSLIVHASINYIGNTSLTASHAWDTLPYFPVIPTELI